MECQSVGRCHVWLLPALLSVAAIGCSWQRPASETAALTSAPTADDSTEWALLQRVMKLPTAPSLCVEDP